MVIPNDLALCRVQFFFVANMFPKNGQLIRVQFFVVHTFPKNGQLPWGYSGAITEYNFLWYIRSHKNGQLPWEYSRAITEYNFLWYIHSLKMGNFHGGIVEQ